MKKFLFSWILSAIVMFAASYMWHGLFLNDFNRLAYPFEIFMVVAAIVYLVLGAVVAKAYETKFFDKYEISPFFKGILVGGLLGMLIFFISIVVGVSFTSNFTLENFVFDLSWQMIEQSLGGVVVSITHYYVLENVFEEID